MMKSRDSLVRLKRFHVEERRRRLAQIESMINEFARMATDLDREIALEEQRAGISDLAHFAYPTYARAARVRRDNLLRSSSELRVQLDDAKTGLDDALADLGKIQSLEGRDKSIDRSADLPEPGRGLGDLGLRAAQA
jgi:flagellar export protein FliJ